MLSRSIAIIACLSLVGVSLVPASLVPCCCKAKFNAQHASSTPSCNHCPATGAARSASAVPACCANQSAELPSSCAGNVVKSDCPRCRCLEQLQIVALSPVSSDQLPVRILSAAVVGEAVSVTSQTDGGLPIVSAQGPPGNPAFLKTCALRC